MNVRTTIYVDNLSKAEAALCATLRNDDFETCTREAQQRSTCQLDSSCSTTTLQTLLACTLERSHVFWEMPGVSTLLLTQPQEKPMAATCLLTTV